MKYHFQEINNMRKINSTLYDRTLCPNQSGDISNNQTMNQITLDDSANNEQALNSLKSLHPYSTSKKSDKEILANN